MAVLVFRAPEGARMEYPLQPVTRIGTSELNEIRLLDETASAEHCELRLENGTVVVTDLGSASGTAIDGEPVEKGVLRHGSVLRVGAVEFVLEDQPGTAADSPPESIGSICRNHADRPADWRCSKCGEIFCGECIVEGRKFGVAGVKFCPLCSSKAESLREIAAEQQRNKEKTFGTELAKAWTYPFQRDGLLILIGGAIFLSIANFSLGVLMLLSLLIFILVTGYLAAYSQKIIQSSANGEDDPPGWPDFSNFVSDMVVPFFHAAGLVALYLLPYFIAQWKLPDGQPETIVISTALLLLGLFMMPMAWLGISMHDSFAGLSPHFVIPSILRIPGQYLVVFLELALLVAISMGIDSVINRVRIPIIGSLASSFASLYFLMVLSRLLGSLYYINRTRLGWFRS